jgi:hypothetical protein
MNKADTKDWIPKAWWYTLSSEVFICLATVIYWVVAPVSYLETAFGIHASKPLEQQLVPVVYMIAMLTFQAMVYLLACLMFTKPINGAERLQSLCYMEQSMLIGDILIDVLTIWSWVQSGYSGTGVKFAQIFMATFWGIIRAIFLRTVGNKPYLFF